MEQKRVYVYLAKDIKKAIEGMFGGDVEMNYPDKLRVIFGLPVRSGKYLSTELKDDEVIDFDETLDYDETL